MKKVIFLGLVFVLLLSLLITGCNQAENKTIELTFNDFAAQNNIVKDIELARGKTLTVRLESNPTTGYQWGEAEISAPDVVSQTSRDFAEPEDTDLVGAPGTDVWVFDSLKTGTAVIKMSYSRPWEGGEKDTYTLTINVTVK